MVDSVIIGLDQIQGIFGWLPNWFIEPQNFDQIVAMQPWQLVVFFAAWLILICFIGPFVEELYFRGHLLPGLARFGAWALLINVVLFSIYHFWSPWQNPARIIALLPLVCLVWYRANIQLSTGVHIALNTLNTIVLIITVLGAG